MLNTIKVTVEDLGELSLNQVQANSRLSLLCTDVELSSLVDVYGGLMSKTCTLIHNGDFVKFSDSETSATVSPSKHNSCQHP